MATDLRHLLTPFKRRSKFCNKDRSLLDGDWKADDEYIKGLFITSTSTDEEHSVSSFSTNATMDNNIGPGRMLDKLYQHLGRKVEWGILRISIASLHPNKIFHCLWDDMEVEHSQAPLSEVIATIHRRRGSMAVAGLQSLVHQTQSNSIYRSAAALAALSSLAATSSLHYTDFYLEVGLVEPIFQKLEIHTKALDDSNTEKLLFLALLALGQEYMECMRQTRYKSNEEIMLSLSRGMTEIMQPDQASQQDHGSLLALCKSAFFVKYIRMLSRREEQAENIECISEAAYLLFLFFLSHINHTISAISNSHYGSLNKLAYFILCECISMFDATVEDILQLFSQPVLLPLLCKLKSSFLVYRSRNKGAKVLLTRIYDYLNEIELTCNIDLRWLPRNSLSTSQSILKIPMKFAMLRSHRLLNSFDELRREAQEPQCYYKYFTQVWEVMYAFNMDSLDFEDLQRWHDRAMEVTISESDLSAEYLEARENPQLTCQCGRQEDYGDWGAYLKRRAIRSMWGEYLRCNMDWDWDSGSCLKRLFKIERPLSPINGALETVEVNCTLQDSDILQVKIGGARATMPEAIQVPYEDGFGRIRYKTFYPGPSTGDLTSIGKSVEQPASHALSERLAPTGSISMRVTKRLRVKQETSTDDVRYKEVYAGESLEDITFAPNESILDGPRKMVYSATTQDDGNGSLASASYNSVSEDSVYSKTLFRTMAPVDDDPMDVGCSESENDQEHVPESQSSRNRDPEYAPFVRDIQDTEERGPIAEFEQSFKQYRDVDELSYADSTTTYYTALSHPCNEFTEIID